MIKILLLAVVPFMTQHRNVVPKTEVSTNFYGSVTGVVTTAYIQERSSIELPEKWALANVTNANGKSVNASDVGALGNSGSQTLNQSYGGLSVTFDAEGALYTGQYAPSKWSITKEVNDQYYYVQFFGFNGTNYPSFNLFDGESDFYVRLPRKEGTLAIQSDVESKADRPALPVAAGNLAALTADGNLKDSGKTASDFLPASSSFAGIWDIWDSTTFRGDLSVGPNGDMLGVYSGHGSLYKFGDTRWYYGESQDPANEIAVKGDISAAISATNPTFSHEVLAVNVDFATNTTGAAYVAVTNALAGFGFDAEALEELPGGKVYGSIGALLAALAAAVAWLKKKALIGGLTGGVPDDPKVHDFFTESNSLLTGLIASKTSGKADQSDLDALAAKVDAANAALEDVA